MNVYTYSFENVAVTFTHPNYGSFSAYGTGIGDLTIQYTDDNTTHTVGADLAVVVSKSAKKNGSITLNVLQTSELNSWLRGLSTYLKTAHVTEWAKLSIRVANSQGGDSFWCTGCSPQKIADTKYGATAETKAWTMMCASIDTYSA